MNNTPDTAKSKCILYVSSLSIEKILSPLPRLLLYLRTARGVGGLGRGKYNARCAQPILNSVLFYRNECITGKYTTRKIYAQLNSRPERRIFHILTSEDIDDVMSSIFTVVCAEHQFVNIKNANYTVA